MKFSKLSVILAASAAFVMPGAATAATFFNGGPNLIVNGGFETGSFAPWVSGGSVFNSVQASTPHTGTFAASMGCVGAGCVVAGPTGISGTGSLTQTLNLQPGIYQFQYYVTNPAGTNQIGASVGNNILTNTSLAVIPYTQFSFVTAVSGGPTDSVVAIRQDPSFMHLDDIALAQVDDGAGNNLAAASQTMTTQVSRDLMDNLFGMLTNSNAGMTYVNSAGNYRAFFNFFGDVSRWDHGDTHGDRAGFMIGSEWSLDNEWAVGVVYGFARSNFGTETLFTDNDGRADENLGGIFAHWSPDCLPGYVSGMVGYGVNANHLMRQNFLGAVGSIVATRQWFGGVEAGYDWQAMPELTLTPFVRFDGASLEQDGYWEYAYGAGLLVPSWVDSKNQGVGRALLGVRGTMDFQPTGSSPWQVSAKLAWQDEFSRRRSVDFSETTGPVTFSGTAIGASPVSSSLVAGVGLGATVANRLRLSVNYNGDFGDGQTIHEGTVGIKFTW